MSLKKTPASYGSPLNLAWDLVKLAGLSAAMLLFMPYLYLRNWLDDWRTKI